MQTDAEIQARSYQQRDGIPMMPLIPQPIRDRAGDRAQNIFERIVGSRRRPHRSLKIDERNRTEDSDGNQIIHCFHSVRMRVCRLFCKTGPLAASAPFVLLLAACSEGPPDGQVLAVVDGTAITQPELGNEFDFGGRVSDVDRREQANEAVESVIDRKLLAAAARDRKLERDPDFHFARRRMEELLLVDGLRKRLEERADISNADITRYISNNPHKFERRKSLTLRGPDGDRTLVYDTARLDETPDWIDMVTPGRDLFVEGTKYSVRSVDTVITSRQARQALAKAMLTEQFVSQETDRILREARQGATIRYQIGWGPSAR